MKLSIFIGKHHEHDDVRANESRAFVHSLEGGIYLLEIEHNGVSQFLECSNTKKPKTFKSFHQAKDFAKNMKIRNIELALNTAYDQMIGLASYSWASS